MTNKGTLNIGGVTDFDIGGATLTNEGSVNLEGGARLNIENSAGFTDASGTVNAGESCGPHGRGFRDLHPGR